MSQAEAERLFLLAQHFERLNTRRSLERAAQLYSQAAHLGHLEAMLRLSMCYWAGIGLSRDRKRSFVWCRRSAESGHATAICRLAVAYDEGYIGEVNHELAELWYRKGVELGEPDCMAQLGSDLIVRNELEAGQALVHRSADLGSPAGLLHWGLYKVLGGRNVKVDVVLGSELLFRARERYWQRWSASSHRATDFLTIGCWGHCEALVAEFILEGRFGIRDLISIVRMLRRAFLCGNKSNHLVPLGDALLELGEAVGARVYWLRAVRLGDTRAAERLRS